MRPGRSALVGLVVFLALSLGFLFAWIDWARTPRGSRGAGPVIVRVEPGSPAREVARVLAERNLVRPAWAFAWWLRLAGAAGRIRAGEYRFDPPVSPVQVARRLLEGRTRLVPVTIREGLTLRETAEVIAAAGIASRRDLVAAFRDPAPIRRLDPRATDLEGYLFPETYRFEPGWPARRVAAELVATFRRRFYEPHRDEIRASDLGLRGIVTVASLVEKETARDDERPLVAAVYLRRLARGMRLQCDPTIVYAKKLAGRWDGRIHRRDLRWDHPYNTYVHAGLPPGPIASPGLASLLAVLHPRDEGYLYFVSRGDGTHAFSRTFREHLAAVRRYQRRRRR